MRLSRLSWLLLFALLAPPAFAEDPPKRERKRGDLALPAGVSVERDVVYAELDGDRSLHLDLYLPEGAENPPLVVWVHGGGWRAGDKKNCWLVWMAGEGFAVASLEYRLSGEATFPAQIHDVKGALRWLRKNAGPKGYDATRIGIGGSSAGGHLAALVGTSGGVFALEGDVGGNLDQSSGVDAVYDVFGPADFRTMANHFSTRSPVAALLGGPVGEKPELAKQASPATYVSDDDPPFWITHGDGDRTVPVEQSRAFAAALDRAGVSVHLDVIEGAGHGGPQFNTQARRDEVLAFFRLHLAGVASASAQETVELRAPSVVATYAAKGPHAIAVRETLVLRDEARDKNLRVRVTFPTGKGRFPVIVWSHGLGGSKDAYDPLVTHWASHGYVVVQATHSDSLRFGREATGFREWQSRPLDVAFVLDSLEKIAASLDGFVGSFDTERIGMGGHSFGAHTTQLVGGATARGPEGARKSHADARPRAFFLLSGQGRGDVLDEESWETLTRPTLVMTGTLDTGRGGQPFTWRTEPYTYAPEGDKTLVLVEGARHTFGGISGSRRGRQQANAAHVDAVRAASLLFWNAYVRGDDAAKAVLRSDRIPASTDNTVRVTWK